MKIAIIGAGIGGLTAAVALRHHGLEAQVYERRPEWRNSGSGVLVPCNAMQVLNRLGAGQPLLANGNRIQRLELFDYRSGRLQTTDLRPFEDRYGAATVAITRSRLHAILRASIPTESLHLGKRCKHIASREQRVRIEFGDGGCIGCELVIGADGLQSTVRGFVAEGALPRYSGQSSYRGIALCDLPPELVHVSQEFWAPRKRAGFVPLANGQVYWFATFNAAANRMDSAEERRARLADFVSTFPEPMSTVIARTPEEEVLQTDISDLPEIRWSRDRVLLIGDAAHATTPNLGQGGGQAIEDGFALALALSESSGVPEGLRAFEAIRRAKAAVVVKRSRQIGQLAHLSNPVARMLRNGLIQSVPDRFSRKQLDSMFSLNF